MAYNVLDIICQLTPTKVGGRINNKLGDFYVPQKIKQKEI